MTTYADLDAKLTGRCSQSRKVANNTYAERRGDDIAIRLHATDVVTFHRDGTITLNTGGWVTVTTKARINDYLPGGLALRSVKGRWYLHYFADGFETPYADGIRIDLDTLTVVSGGQAGPDVAAEDADNTGDCVLCRWPGRETEADHLAQHVEDQYVMYTLARNAVAARGYRDPDVIMWMILAEAEQGKVSTMYTQAMRKYLRKALTVGAVAVA